MDGEEQQRRGQVREPEVEPFLDLPQHEPAIWDFLYDPHEKRSPQYAVPRDARHGWVWQAEAGDRANDVEHRQPDSNDKTTTDVMLQFQVLQRIHAIDIAQVEPHGNEPRDHADAQL